MTRKSHLAIIAIALAGAVEHADADVLYLKNGDRITGEIKRVWDGEVFIEAPYTDEFAVEMIAVERIESDREFEIELRDHSEVTGRFDLDEFGDMVLVTESGEMPFSPAAIEELDEPEEYFDWSARSDLSFSGSSGNTDTSDFLWQAEGDVKIGDHRHRVNLRFDSKSQDGATTKEQYESSYGYNFFVTDRWFLGAGVGHERDPIRRLSDRITLGAGAGFQFFEDADRLLEVSLAAVGVRENLAGVSGDSTTAAWTLRYRRDITSDFEVYHDHVLSVYLNGRTNNVADTTTGFRWDVWGDIYMNAQIDWNWESDPALGSEQEDITYALGIGIELD